MKNDEKSLSVQRCSAKDVIKREARWRGPRGREAKKSSCLALTSSYFLARIAMRIHYYGLRRKYYGLRRNSYEHGGCVNDTGWCVTIYIMLYM